MIVLTVRRLPLVLARQEVAAVLAQLRGTMWIVGALLCGAGLRLQECLDLRVKDLDFARREIVVRHLTFAAGTADLADARAFVRWLTRLRKTDWVVYAKRPFAGPEPVLAYLGRYTHRVALSNDRLQPRRRRGARPIM